MQTLKEKYKKEVIPAMMQHFSYKSIMAVPRIEKVVINTGFGKQTVHLTADEQRKLRESVANDIALISGQRPILTRAKKSISTFKLREGMIIGAKVTLRRRRMDDFIEKLIKIALPRSRDFRGIDPKSLDDHGNLTLPIKEHIVFPEVTTEKAKQIFGLEVTIATSAKTKEEGLELLKLLGFPIK